MKHLKTISILICLLFCSQGISQNIEIKTKSEKIEVLKDSTFTNEITVEFKQSEVIRYYPIIYDSELEQISDIQLYEKKRKRLKEIPVGEIEEEKVELDYINSKKIKNVFIPAETDVVLKYLVQCKELMYFSSLHFSTYNETDSLYFDIEVPKEFYFLHNTINKDSIPYYSIDSTKTEQANFWNIKLSPKQIKPNPLYFFGIYKNVEVPFMRTLVTPDSYTNQPQKYMNDWYIAEASQAKGLSPVVKNKIDELTVNITEPGEIVNIIYNYIKTNFKYVAIEIGMGAFIPSHANEVFNNKQGDCKDLSNFLTEALNYKGIKSDIALASTFDHISDCNFPSLSAANHVISVAYIDDKLLLLDPTDFIHRIGTPVQSLQDRTIFIINSDGGQFHKVDRFPPKMNEICYNAELYKDVESELIKGNFDVVYKGISGNYLSRIDAMSSENEFSDFSKDFFSEVFGDQAISNLRKINDTEELTFSGDLTVNGKFFEDELKQYLFIDFLPDLFENETRESLLEGTYLRTPFSKKVRVKINLESNIQPFETITNSFSDKGISLDLSINFVSENTIECKYDFVFDYIFTTNENIDATNDILKSFKDIINEPIVLEKQKN